MVEIFHFLYHYSGTSRKYFSQKLKLIILVNKCDAYVFAEASVVFFLLFFFLGGGGCCFFFLFFVFFYWK